MKKRHPVLLPIALGALALATLAGCASPTATSEIPTASPTTSAADTASSDDGTIPDIPSGTGIFTATTMTSCDTKGTNVAAKGTVTMPEDKKGDIVISVSWVDSTNSSVYNRGVATLKDPKPGEKKDWTIESTVPADAQNLSCVLGAVIPE
ncbi:hypothetical protein ACRAWB_13795 [Leifsonia poae]|uniref:hypothetical protein n=1 Tax=Leifsonia poae TaxID=110933 RepID=UPI003D68B0C4